MLRGGFVGSVKRSIAASIAKSAQDCRNPCRPLPACPAGEGVQRLSVGRRRGYLFRPLPACPAGEGVQGLSVGRRRGYLFRPLLACPAGEGVQRLSGPSSPRTASPAAQGGRGRRETNDPMLALELLHLPLKAAGVEGKRTIQC